jgi:hypothetical protein
VRRLAWLRFFLPLLVLPLLAWATGALLLGPYGSPVVRSIAAVLLVLVTMGFAWRVRRRGVALAAVVTALPSIAVACAWPFLTGSPRNDREWTQDQERLVTAAIDGDRLVVRNVRNFRWRSLTDYEASWEDRTYDLARLVRVWFVLVPFHDQDEVAHTFLSFEFEDGGFLAVSPEIRKERGESFSAAGGLFRNYELFYTVGDERDLVKIRTDFFGDEVFVYPIKSTKEGARLALVDIAARLNSLAANPEFYDALTNSCASNVARHANAVVPGQIPTSWRVTLPGWSDELALELGLIDFEGTLADARATFKANDRAAAAGDSPDFSAKIRGR